MRAPRTRSTARSLRPKVNRDRVSIAIDRTFGRASGGRHNEVSCHAEEKGRRRCGSKGRERDKKKNKRYEKERETVGKSLGRTCFCNGT